MLRVPRGPPIEEDLGDDPDDDVHFHPALNNQNYIFNGMLFIRNRNLLNVIPPIQVEYSDSDSDDDLDEAEETIYLN